MAAPPEDKLDAEYQEAIAVLETLADPYNQRTALEAGPATRPFEGLADSPAKPKWVVVERQWSKELLRNMLESLPDAMVVINRNGRIVLCNQQTEKTFGYSRDELLDQLVELLVPKRFRDGHGEMRDGYFANPRTRPMGANLSLFGMRRSGDEFPVEISLSPLHAEEELLVTATIRDITERKKEEAKFRALVEQVPAVTFTAPLDDTSPKLYVSPQIEELLGFTQKEWIEDPVLWYRQLHPDDREKWNNQFAPTCAMGRPFREVYRFIAKDGRVVWVQGAANLVRDEQGNPLFLQGMAFDITPIKEAEQTHRKLAAIVESSDDAIISKTLDGIIVSWNKGAERIYGYSQKEMVGQSITRLLPAERPGEIQTILQTIKQGRYVEHFETVRVRKDGQPIDVSLTISPIHDAKGTIIGASAIARDITLQKQTQATLEEQACFNVLEAAVSTAMTRPNALRRMLQDCTEALVQNLGVAFARIWTLNEEENVLELQASARMYTHLDGPHGRVPVGKFKIGWIAEEKRPHVTNDVVNDPRVSNQEWAKREGMVSFAGFPLVIDDRLVGVLALFAKHPLTDRAKNALELVASHVSLGIKRKQSEEELEQRVARRTRELAASLEALHEKTEELEQFAHVAAHDFNQPLRSLLNYPKKLAQKCMSQLDEQAAEWLNRTLAGGERMKRLITDVGQFSKVLRRERIFEPIDANEVFENACANLQAAIHETKAKVTADNLPTVVAHHTDFILLLQNLIGNAIKFHAPDRKPKVHVSVRQDSDTWIFHVGDNGIGMEEKYLQRIFELGERLHSSSKYAGTGFGLAICEKIVRTHGGRIWAESTPGEGSVFCFTLPMNDPNGYSVKRHQ